MGTLMEESNRRQAVNLTQCSSFGATARTGLRETFFPDDPFRHISGRRHASGKAIAALEYFVPILEWAPKYRLSDFWYDLLAGITVASLAIPQGISYARLAQLPPIVGLYSSFVPPLVYAVFGSSKNLAVGTVAASSLLLASIIGEAVPATADPALYLRLAFTAAFFSGVIQVAFGVFRLGILVDFLSRSTITGFMGGTAMLIILQQLKGMLGMTHFTTKTDIVSVMHAIFAYRHEWRWQSALLGLCFLCFLLFTRYLKSRLPRLFWVSAISPLLVVIAGGVFAYTTHADDHGIPIVGPLKRGINPISIGELTFHSKYVGTALKAGFITAFLALAEGIAVGRSLALLKDQQTDGNKEMIAFGLMNIVGSFTSCYLTTGPFSKSAVNFHAGCKTAMSNVVMSICIMWVLLFFAPLFKYTPLVALSAIIIVAMIGLIEYEKAYQLFKVDKIDFFICMAAFFGVLFVSMIVGLSLSVGLSILRALLHVARPTTCKLGSVEGSDIYRDTEQYANTSCHPGILILQLGSPIYFANCSYLRERISRWVESEGSITSKDKEELDSEGSIVSKDKDDLQYIVLDLSGVSSIDHTGIGMLYEVQMNLERRGIKAALVNPRSQVAEKLVLSKFIDSIGSEWVFLSVKDAVAGCQFALQQSSGHREEAQV